MLPPTYGRLDYLFNNAGIAEPAWTDFARLTEAQLDKILSINVKGVYLGIKHAMPLMAESGGGVIINCSSPGGTIAFIPELIAYSASKAGVTDSLHQDDVGRKEHPDLRCRPAQTGVSHTLCETPVVVVQVA